MNTSQIQASFEVIRIANRIVADEGFVIYRKNLEMPVAVLR